MPSRTIKYVFLLADGATVVLMGTNREEDSSFIDLMQVMAASLSR